jgi:hypothetical protein
VRAHLAFTDTAGLVAIVETGGRIVAKDSRKMAEQLRLACVTAENFSVADWKDDPDRAPMSADRGDQGRFQIRIRALNGFYAKLPNKSINWQIASLLLIGYNYNC